MSKYFSPAEFKRCTPSCSIKDMDPDFLELLDQIREDAGIPLVLTCAYRSKAWELEKGRSGNSAHTRGLAVDIRCNTSANRYAIIDAALANNVRRIGVGKTFVHIDADTSLPQDVFWDYYE